MNYSAHFVLFLQLQPADFVLQNAREDSLVASSMVTPQKPGSCIENALHKDVFGVISGTGKYSLRCLSIYGCIA